ncbi:MAG: bifunctional tetrahydrofolate synthase/dihydrofolate synthase [Thiogranum sp.]
MVDVPRFTSLQDWLTWQESLHPVAIDLGLERVARVADRLVCRTPAPVTVTVAGTNGKGSSVALLEAILRRAGHRVAAYTSPHLHRYNERLRFDGEPVGDAALCEAFARVDAARGDDSLTYFEFGTLAALDLMSRRRPDVALLEVGLGGRLDAVNIVDADVALITGIGIDHTDWLGADRDAIAREKAGIMRPGRPVICGDRDPPAALNSEAGRLGAPLALAGHDFAIARDDRGWSWRGRFLRLEGLPEPVLPGAHQKGNAAAVLAVLEVLQPRLPVPRAAVVAGLREAVLPGRIQCIAGAVEQVLDVSHNAQAAAALAQWLETTPAPGRCHAVVGMMRDKDAASFLQPLLPHVDHWYVTGLQLARAGPSEWLATELAGLAGAAGVTTCARMPDALSAVQGALEAGDRVLVCGSFHTVAEWSALNPEF